MIAYIKYTRLEVLSKTSVLLFTDSGIGYEVVMSECTNISGAVYIHHHITDRGQTLYGFEYCSGVDLFRDLCSVNAVGPVAAMKLMTHYTLDKIRIDIADGDVIDLAKAKGIGNKSADAIIHKLKNKYKEFTTRVKAPDINLVQDVKTKYDVYINMAKQGLLKLGYKNADAAFKLNKVSDKLFNNIDNAKLPSGDDLVGLLIKEALVN